MQKMSNTLIPIGWTKCCLGEVLSVKNGFAFKSNDYSSEGIPLIRISDIQNGKVSLHNSALIPQNKANPDFLVETGDLLIAMSGATTGKIGVYEGLEPCLQNQRVGNFKIISEDVLDKKFRNFYIYSLRKQIEIIAYGGAQPNISSSLLESLEILLPPLNEQRRIVAKLEKLLAKVDICKERLDKIPAILKRFRQSVLSAACSGRLTADWRENNPDVESAEELLKLIYQERKKRYEDECQKAKQEERRKPKQPSFGDVEEYDILTWNLTTLESVVEVVVDCPHSTPEWIENGRICVRTNNFKPFKLDLIDVKYVSEESYQDRILRLEPKAGDVLYSREGGILGIACQIPPGVNLCLGQRMMLIRGNQNWLSGEYLTMLLNSEVVLSQVKELITGTASPHLNVGDVRSFKIPIPPLPEQKEIINRVQTLFKTADQIEQRYQKARTYVDKLTQSILAKAFRGELVSQDPKDEPASVLLERIRAERENRENVAKTAKKPASNKGRRSKKAQPQLEPIQLELPGMESNF
jgi:type I restriction enzyme S subunit